MDFQDLGTTARVLFLLSMYYIAERRKPICLLQDCKCIYLCVYDADDMGTFVRWIGPTPGTIRWLYFWAAGWRCFSALMTPRRTCFLAYSRRTTRRTLFWRLATLHGTWLTDRQRRYRSINTLSFRGCRRDNAVTDLHTSNKSCGKTIWSIFLKETRIHKASFLP